MFMYQSDSLIYIWLSVIWILSSSALGDISKVKWCYQDHQCGERTWPSMCTSGSLQSPIDLSSKQSFNDSCTLKNFPRHTYFSNLFNMESNGRTVGIKLLDFAPTFHWEQHQSSYILHSIHFHWGDKDYLGSEHTIDAHPYALEMQMVHYQTEFKSIGMALASGKPNSLAVISVLFRVDEGIKANLVLLPILNYLPGVYHSNAVITVKEQLDLRKFMKGHEIWSYMGSLTSPSCVEQVAWIVWKKIVAISQSDINVFRNVLNHNGKRLVNNYRSLQPRNNRSINICQVTFEKMKNTK